MKSLSVLLPTALLCTFVLCQCHADENAQKTAKQKANSAQTDPTKAKKNEIPPPTATIESISYGSHPKQVLTFWKAESPRPTPLLFYIHGGGWQGGNRMAGMAGYVPAMNKAGISVVSIEYRFIEDAIADGVVPPVKACLHDAARALQFTRSKAREWNIDTTKIAAAGGSAGACSSLWLAFHDDLADPNSSDPVARESSRLICAAVSGAQTTLDPKQMQHWIPNSSYGSHAFGIFKNTDGKRQRDFELFLAKREEIMPWIQEYSPFHLVSKDDPPVYLFYNNSPAKGKITKDPTHSANFGILLREKLDDAGVPCELSYPGAPDSTHKTVVAYLIAQLQK
jgi:acetyl esterase/lipase